MPVVAGVQVSSGNPYADLLFDNAQKLAPYATPVEFGPVPGGSDAERFGIALRAFDPFTRGGQEARDQVAAFAQGIKSNGNPAGTILRETVNFRRAAARRAARRCASAGARSRPARAGRRQGRGAGC